MTHATEFNSEPGDKGPPGETSGDIGEHQSDKRNGGIEPVDTPFPVGELIPVFVDGLE